MPEAPAIMHLKDQMNIFKGKIVKDAGGYGKMKTAWIKGKKLIDILTWGKHLLFVFKEGTVRVHLGLFGEVLLNERKNVNRSFYLTFANGEINGYIIRALLLEKTLKETYDWRTDILSAEFDKGHVRSLIKLKANKTIDDVLMDQAVFSGVGNKIRNESLYLAGIHPLSLTGKIPPGKITKLINEVITYAKYFYDQLGKKGVHDTFNVYQQEYAADGSEVTMKVLPSTKRKIFFSEHRQQLYV